jgi:uncharacterized heparinase superfamily protein
MLRLSAQGTRLEGSDRIFRNSGFPMLQGNRNLPFSLHFHCHPAVSVTRSETPGMAMLALPNGETWRFTALGADLGLEESVYLASVAGPVHGVQIVLRGLALGDTEVRWRLELARQQSDATAGQDGEET